MLHALQIILLVLAFFIFSVAIAGASRQRFDLVAAGLATLALSLLLGKL